MLKHTSQYSNSSRSSYTTFESTSVRLIRIVIVSEKETFSSYRWKKNNSVISVQRAYHKEFGHEKTPSADTIIRYKQMR